MEELPIFAAGDEISGLIAQLSDGDPCFGRSRLPSLVGRTFAQTGPRFPKSRMMASFSGLGTWTFGLRAIRRRGPRPSLLVMLWTGHALDWSCSGLVLLLAGLGSISLWAPRRLPSS